ncbi:hypothetical protein IFM51744_09623 [Aspergillus udagawae]|uniref:Uncharacterized protein n=1 Tax=Aspergillus udagawae TaxID=91492 RepID=A0ABQ1ATD2_9EURO|nr:hypothetical protein IFM51744_09623 [Aspergillus udagawae]GFF87697.1 hypothetical protein IFM53868_05237 [Aspergillus udagawae]GFG09910.1 hypothetical protein IFM5058_04661 [Aspergillus udagawae]
MTTSSKDSNPDGWHLSRLGSRFGEWLLKRDTTAVADSVASTSATESATYVTTTSRVDATATSGSTTALSTSTTSSSFTTTTATATTTSDTTSSTSSTATTPSSSASTAASATTTTAATTTITSTTTPTPTESAELKKWNHRGTIAAIITFSILGSFFLGACIARCIHNRVKKRRIDARNQHDKESSLSMLTLTPEKGKSASQLKLDRESIMFCDERRSQLETVPSLSGQSCWQGSVVHSSMPSEDMGRSMSSGRHTPLGVREQHETAEV